MNLIELQCALKQLRLSGMAAVLEMRLHQAQAEPMAPIDLISCLVSDELTRRGDRLLERRKKDAEFRDPQVSLDNFDCNFNKKMNRSLIFDLATPSSSQSMKTLCFWVHRAPVRATWPRPSVSLRFNKATGSFIVRPTRSSTTLPRPRSMENGSSRWNCSQRFRCSSSTISACANYRRPPPKTYWRSSCGAMNGPARF